MQSSIFILQPMSLTLSTCSNFDIPATVQVYYCPMKLWSNSKVAQSYNPVPGNISFQLISNRKLQKLCQFLLLTSETLEQDNQ